MSELRVVALICILVASERGSGDAPAVADSTHTGELEPGRNCWRIERATKAAVIIDAADYFEMAREAMLAAKRRIMLIGWDFDARIRLRPEESMALGDFILQLVRDQPQLEVYLLRWDMGAVKSLFRGSTILTLIRWITKRRIHTKLDSVHPTGASHHQKIMVIDDCFAFCGGIDMTGDRWDTREHEDGEPRRLRPNGKPYGPWHDATTALEGPVAAALGNLSCERWERATGRKLKAIEANTDCWPATFPAQFTNTEVAISRTCPKLPDLPEIREIEQLFIDQISRAKRHIYAESQYFASRKIAEAIGRRLQEEDGPEVVLVNPTTAQGWLEQAAMDSARARLYQALHKLDGKGRLRLYHPYTATGQPIYVHAKILVIDDKVLRVGSSNLNNRSLGLDTECDVTIDASRDADADKRTAIRAIRDGLIAEHLGAEPQEIGRLIDETGSLIAVIEQLCGAGRTLRPYEVPDLPAVESWLADNEVLDPEDPDDMFEAVAKRGLFNFLRRAKKSPRSPVLVSSAGGVPARD